MKKFLLSLAIIAITISAAIAQTRSKTYNFGNITGVDASYVYSVNVTKGNSDKIEVICPDYLNEYMDIHSQGGILYLKMNLPRNFRHPRNSDQEIVVNMQMRTITYIDLSGASSFSATGDFTTENLSYDLSGASRVRQLNISGKSVKMDCSGASSIIQNGNFNYMELDCSGASKMNVSGDIGNIHGEISGATNFNYSGNSSKIEMGLSGASKANFQGKTNNFNVGCSGASYINARDMIATEASVEASGASKVNVYVTNTLKTDASSGSLVNYYGNPKQVLSRPSNVRKAD
jgi:Putative auto-transporter adhesin, head GIN domain